MKFTMIFEDMGKLFLDLAKTLPRFEVYLNILDTPRLHDSLRAVYVCYIEFNFIVIRFLKSDECCQFLFTSIE